MKSLDKFFRIIEIAGNPIEGGYKAYKMDDSHKKFGMKRFVGLGECNCCDYFLPRENSIVLIEETRLSESIQYFRDKYKYLDDSDKDDFAIKNVRNEMRLKTYGSMLVLCRLTAKSREVRELFQGKRYDFWLVASNMNGESMRAFDNLKDTLLSMLRGALSKEILDKVEVFPSNVLENRLSENDPTP